MKNLMFYNVVVLMCILSFCKALASGVEVVPYINEPSGRLGVLSDEISYESVGTYVHTKYNNIEWWKNTRKIHINIYEKTKDGKLNKLPISGFKIRRHYEELPTGGGFFNSEGVLKREYERPFVYNEIVYALIESETNRNEDFQNCLVYDKEYSIYITHTTRSGKSSISRFVFETPNINDFENGSMHCTVNVILNNARASLSESPPSYDPMVSSIKINLNKSSNSSHLIYTVRSRMDGDDLSVFAGYLSNGFVDITQKYKGEDCFQDPYIVVYEAFPVPDSSAEAYYYVLRAYKSLSDINKINLDENHSEYFRKANMYVNCNIASILDLTRYEEGTIEMYSRNNSLYGWLIKIPIQNYKNRSAKSTDIYTFPGKYRYSIIRKDGYKQQSGRITIGNTGKVEVVPDK